MKGYSHAHLEIKCLLRIQVFLSTCCPSEIPMDNKKGVSVSPEDVANLENVWRPFDNLPYLADEKGNWQSAISTCKSHHAKRFPFEQTKFSQTFLSKHRHENATYSPSTDNTKYKPKTLLQW